MARLPCLATLSPAPATTKAVVVDTLKVPAPSPPVPTVSTKSSPSARARQATGVALSRITRAAPAISARHSPFMRRATRKAPIWAGVACPSMIWSMAAIICSSLRSCPLTARAMAS